MSWRIFNEKGKRPERTTKLHLTPRRVVEDFLEDQDVDSESLSSTIPVLATSTTARLVRRCVVPRLKQVTLEGIERRRKAFNLSRRQDDLVLDGTVWLEAEEIVLGRIQGDRLQVLRSQ